MPAKVRYGQSVKVSKAEIIAAKLALDAARRLGDELRTDLAEETLNNLLDRYHTYHASQRRE